MNTRSKTTFAVAMIAVVMLTTTVRAGAEDSVAAARDLYAAADYDEALAVLNRLRDRQHPAEESRAIELYRALCLMALGRATDADRAMEAMISQDPAYRPSDSDLSPRVRSVFVDVRRRMLPAIIQQRYSQAKAAFERQEFAAAAQGFTQVLDGLSDPDIASAAGQPPLSDLRTLATGFQELSVKAATPPPPPPPPPSPPLPPMPDRRVYSADDPNVVVPVSLRQTVPPYPGEVFEARTGSVEVIIDETGAVESAVIRTSIEARYDMAVVTAAKGWKYKPATLNGVPIKFRKTIQIAVRR